MPRGELWLPEELKVLYEVVQDSCDLDILMSSRHANAVEWEPIAQEMVRYGFRRTWQQCRAKWKALRRAFHLENEHKLLYGCHSEKRPPNYNIMLKMWQKAGRPVFRDQHMLHSRKTRLQRASRRTDVYNHRTDVYNSFGSISHGNETFEEGALFSKISEEFPFIDPQVSLEQHILEDEDIKPVILHHVPETKSDTESSADKCQELQLLEKLVMQQKEIITRLDYLNHNLVQMASLHYQHMAESSTDSVKTKSQDSALSGNYPVPFPSMFIPFPIATSTESSLYTTYITAPHPPATYIHYSESSPHSEPSSQISATYIPSCQPGATYLPPSQSAKYIPSSQLPSSLCVRPSRKTPTCIPDLSPTGPLSQSGGHPSARTLTKKHRKKIH